MHCGISDADYNPIALKGPLFGFIFSISSLALGGLNALRKVPCETAINHKRPPSDTWKGGHGSGNCHS